MRKDGLVTNQAYHIFTRSIADYKIFNDTQDYARMLQLLQFFSLDEPPSKFSVFLQLEIIQHNGFQAYFNKIAQSQKRLISIIAYCLMPTHLHLILKQQSNNGISQSMRKALDSYSRFFNVRHKRKGPLWEGRFQSRLVKSDEQLLHLSRYIHLNPVTANLVEKPEEWEYSSYSEYISRRELPVCQFDDLISINPKSYQIFVDGRKDYQRELAKLKLLILD